jgi:hypothetical protein
VEYVTKRSDEPGWTSAERQRRIVKFLTGIDYMPGADKIENVVETKATGANGGMHDIYAKTTQHNTTQHNTRTTQHNPTQHSTRYDKTRHCISFHQPATDVLSSIKM